MTSSLSRLLLAAALLLAAGPACRGPIGGGGDDHDLAAADQAEPAPVLRRVDDPSLVCMVTNQVIGMRQIPVEVEGKTYYGCCPNCKTRLAQDPSARFATDPVSGARVDKASAVIGSDRNGRVHYFASEENLRRYTPGS